MTQAQIELLSPDRFLTYWPSIERQLDCVTHLWSLWWTKEALRDGVLSESLQCWGVGDQSRITGVIFSQVSIYPANTIFQAFLAFGDGLTGALDEIEATFERYCAMRGARVAEVTGRPGWEPLLRKKGFGRTGTVMSKQLAPMRMQ